MDPIEDYDPFPITADDFDPSKQFTINYVASRIQNHLDTRAIDATDDEILGLFEYKAIPSGVGDFLEIINHIWPPKAVLSEDSIKIP